MAKLLFVLMWAMRCFFIYSLMCFIRDKDTRWIVITLIIWFAYERIWHSGPSKA